MTNTKNFQFGVQKNAEYYAKSKFVYTGSKRFQTSITAKKIKAK